MRCNSTDRSRGGGLIEFAIVLPLFWLMMTGGFQLVRGIYAYARLVEAVSRGARFAMRVDFDEPNHAFTASVANVVICGSTATCASPAVPGLTAANVRVTWTKDTAGTPSTITVAIQSFSYRILLRTFSWNGKPAVTVRYAGVFKS
jgi:Flp pilus assembly protein TadG